nr:hypothetical protein [uncultured Gellertiella sp.]
MSKIEAEAEDQQDKPLDPAMERVRVKLVRLQLISAGIMLVLLMAVLGTIVYKITRPDPRASASLAGAGVPVGDRISAVASLPAGFQVRSVSLSGGQILFYGTSIGVGERALVFDIATSRIIAEITIK